MILARDVVVMAVDGDRAPRERPAKRLFERDHRRRQHDGTVLAREIERTTGIETRVTKLGYMQRGGSPSPFDRILATRFGIKAYEMVEAGEWGRMAALQGNYVVSIPLEEAVSSIKYLDEEIYRVAEVFFG